MALNVAEAKEIYEIKRAQALASGLKDFVLPFEFVDVYRVLKKNNLDRSGDDFTWWFSAFVNNRNIEDKATHDFLRIIMESINPKSRILATGCGTGWFLFCLAQKGFSNLHGFDYMPDVVNAAKDLVDLSGYPIKIWQDDGFDPQFLDGKYDLIFCLHWLFSAWVGNYGNTPHLDSSENVKLLDDLFSKYYLHVRQGGMFVIEVVDSYAARSRYRPSDLYPIRHRYEEVEECANKFGFKIVLSDLTIGYGHQPRMTYFCQKIAVVD